mmetsp:Transcript_36505/g.85501  ORF Transcript_36505/g.85501 Transcript_36505/m.85501 type:complete len:316 (+) Transcript_36505:32-979(+)
MASSRPPDVEALLGRGTLTPQAGPSLTWCFRRAAVLALLGAAALSALVAGRRRKLPLFSEAENLVGLDGIPDGCFKRGMFYAGPHKLEGSTRTVEATPQDCQLRCGRTFACAQFSWWPDGGCLLTDDSSELKASTFKWSWTVVGPRSCEDLSAYDALDSSGDSFCQDVSSYAGPSEGLHDCKAKCDRDGRCKFFSIWMTGGQHWCRLTASCVGLSHQPGHTIGVYKRHQMALPGSPFEVSQPVALPFAGFDAYKGVNGTSCDAYPACRAAGLAGRCCPNHEKVTLSCCNGPPPALPGHEVTPVVPRSDPPSLTAR